MSVTDAGGRWRLEGRELWNKKTNQLKLLEKAPPQHEVDMMTENQFAKKCAQAFSTGRWPE
jgi:hypothetical protein